VTFSGGEPLLQPDFLLAALQAARDTGLHTAVDTCGFADPELVRRAAALTDLWLYDLKLVDDARHRSATGASVEPILANLAALDRAGATLWLRVPLIPGVNDDAANLDGLGRAIAGLSRRHPVFLLPYHREGAQKRQQLTGSDPAAELAPPGEGAIAAAVARLGGHGLDIHVGG
jgi:pyruvate formate lyase activating enzyme